MLNMRNRWNALRAWALCAALCCSAGPLAAQDLRIRGSATFLPFMQSVAEDYMAQKPQASVVVSGGGSSRGIKALLDGTADIAITSGPLTESMQHAFDISGVRLRYTTVGFRPLVVVVHPSNPLQDLSMAELTAIFSGRLGSWPAQGGKPSQPIALLVGPPGGGVTQAFRELLFGEDENFSPRARVLARQSERMEALARQPQAISYLALGSAPGPVKPLAVNGAQPTPENVQSGAYLLRTPLILVARTPATAAVADFLQALSTPRPAWQTDGLVYVSGQGRTSAP